MFAAGVVASVTALTQADPAACDRAGLAGLVATSQEVRSWLDAFDARIAVQASRLAAQGECEPAGSLLAGGGRRSAREAEAAARRGAVCDLMPSLHDALAGGAVSAGHADAVARVASQLDDAGRVELADHEATLVDSAKATSVEAFEREVRELGRILSRDDGLGRHERLRKERSVKRWVDRVTGLCHTHIALDPEADAKVAAALDAAVAAEQATQGGEERTFDQLRADVIVGLITGARTAGRGVPEVSVLIDLDTLRDGLHDHSVAETGDGQPLPPESIRRLCCDAYIIPVVLGGDGVVLDVGRQARVANREQRRALRAMYRTCGHPGCTVRFADCEIHHVIEWNRLHGLTDLANLLPLCNRHHHLVHDGGWHLALHPDRTITLRRPDGTVHFHGTTIDVAPTGTAADTPRPGETEIPLHLRRAARPAETTAEPEPSAAEPADTDGTEHDATSDAIVVTLARARARALGPPTRAPAA